MEWVQGEFADSADTVDGRFQHRRVDRPAGSLVIPEGGSDTPTTDDERIHARSVLLSDDALAAIARIDLVEADGVRATPVDYKRGAVPDVPGNAYEPERVQLCLRGCCCGPTDSSVMRACSTSWAQSGGFRFPSTMRWCNGRWSCSVALATWLRAVRYPLRWRTAPNVRAVPWWESVCPMRSCF